MHLRATSLIDHDASIGHLLILSHRNKLLCQFDSAPHPDVVLSHVTSRHT